MKHNPQPSTASVNDALNAAVEARAAELRAQLDADSPFSNDHDGGPVGIAAHPIKPVIVSCQVSTYMEADPGRGSFSVQLAVDDATITTCVTLEQCSDFSLRCAAYDSARRILAVQLYLARAGRRITSDHPCAPTKGARSKSARRKQPEVQRDSFWVSEARTDGAPDFEATAWNTTDELASSAAFAEFAFHRND